MPRAGTQSVGRGFHTIMAIMRDTVTLDKVGRVVLPKRLRDKLHLSLGDILDVSVEGGDAALLFLQDVRDRLTPIALDESEYFQTAEQAAQANLASGAIYDAILGQCALKAKAETLYTWNTKDFLRLPEPIAGRVRRPDQAT
jgi:AbrB family looped-hinge helix DNA binding protein